MCPVTDPGVTEVKVLLPGSDEVSLRSIWIVQYTLYWRLKCIHKICFVYLKAVVWHKDGSGTQRCQNSGSASDSEHCEWLSHYIRDTAVNWILVFLQGYLRYILCVRFPVFQRGGTVVPRRAGCGSSTLDLQQHPITLTVALDSKVTTSWTKQHVELRNVQCCEKICAPFLCFLYYIFVTLKRFRSSHKL